MIERMGQEPRRQIPTGLRIAGGAVLLIGMIVAMWFLIENDVSGQLPDADDSIGAFLKQYGYLAGFVWIYVEESGVPLFLPGDAFLLYVGNRLPQNIPVFVAAWLGFILAVTLGASNLYLLSRRFGRRLIEHRLAKFLHLTPERIEEADRWFRRWGPWALIFGRHIPGLRVPLTVVAGVLDLPYRIFAISVAVSSAVWAAAFLLLGALFGNAVERSIRSHPFVYVGVVGAATLIIVTFFLVRSRLRAREAARN